MFLIGDTESDGLLSSATNIWCASFYDTEKDITFRFYPLEDFGYLKGPANVRDFYIESVIEFLCNRIIQNNFYLVGHNFITHDVPLFEKIYGLMLPKEKIIDTLILSKMFFPDIKGHKQPHSLEAWGERFGIEKPYHEDWTRFSPEMLNRNTIDTEINVMLFKELQSKGFKI